MLFRSKRFEEDERFLNVGDRRSVQALVFGIVKLVFKSNVIILSECHFCPFFLLNIIFIGLLTMYDYEILIKKNNFNIIMHGVNVMNR